MKYYYTVQDGARVVYEGPVEARAVAMFKKFTDGMDEASAEYEVRHNDRMRFLGRSGRAAKREYYDRCEELGRRGHRTDTVRFEVRAGGRQVAMTVRPFEERLLGGDAQHGRTGTQFGG